MQENKQFLTIARLRAEAEELFAQRLGDIEPATDRITGGFTADDGASARKVTSNIYHKFDVSVADYHST